MSKVTYKVSVEPDNVRKGLWMVAIRREHGSCLWIPLRGVTKEIAESSVESIRYAFGYGVHAYSIERIDIEIT